MADVVRLSIVYNTRQAATDLSRLDAGLDRLEKRSGAAQGGIKRLEGAVRNLATRAVGATGPIGQLASGLLSFAGPVGLAIAATIGGIGLAIRALGADARETTRAQEELNAALEKLGEHGKVLASRRRLEELTRQRDEPTVGERARRLSLGFIGPSFGGASLAEQDQRLERAIAKAKIELAEAERGFAPIDKSVAWKKGPFAQEGALLGRSLSRNPTEGLEAVAGEKGLLSLAEPFIGPVLSGFRTVFSLFDNSQERRQKEQIAQLKRIEAVLRPLAEPELVSVSLVDSQNGARSIAAARRATRRDAVVRVPTRA